MAGLSEINGQSEDGLPFEMVRPFNPMQEPVRRLSAAEDDGPEGQWEVFHEEPEEGEFDTFSIKITQTMNYVLTEELIQQWIDQGAFMIEDGRERTHGPLVIKEFSLHDPEEPEWFGSSPSSDLAEVVPGQDTDPVLGADSSRAIATTTTALAAFVVAVLGAMAVVNLRSACGSRGRRKSFYRSDVLHLAQVDVQYSSVECEVSPSNSRADA